MAAMERSALWRARYDLAWTSVLLWVAGFGVPGEPMPEVHAYLASLYYRLAGEHEMRGRVARAGRLRQIAGEHERDGSAPDPDLPPKVAAMGMPVPRPPVRTDARGSLIRPGPWTKAGDRLSGSRGWQPLVEQ